MPESREIYRGYDVLPGGETFVFTQRIEQFNPRRTVVVLNWFDELRNRMAEQ